MSDTPGNYPSGTVDLSDSPAALDDATFDSLFPAEPRPVVAAPAATTPPAPQPTQTQQTPPQTAPSSPEFYLKGDRSVYKTAEDAIQGINQKDAVIEQLRQRYALTTGVDPITGKPVGVQTPQEEDNYYTNPKSWMDALLSAAKSNDPTAYRDVQAKFMLDTLRPLQPVLQRAAREQAVEELKADAEVGNAQGIIGSPAYTKALDANPELKEAIAIAESDYRWHSRLRGLYKTAILASQGMQVREILAQRQNQTPQSQTPPAPRPTATSTTSSMPQQVARPSFKTLDGIKATIAEMEGKGVGLDF